MRAIKEMSPAPRGALLYPRFSREELEGMFLDLMPNPASKDKRDSSLAENQRPCPGVWDGALGDPRDMVKAGLPDSPVSRRRNSSSAGKTPVTGASPVAASYSGRRNLQGMERCPVTAFKETNRTPKSVLPGFPWVLRPASAAARRALPPSWTSIMVAPAAGLSRSLAPSPSLRSVTAPTVRRDAPPRSNRGRGCRLPSRRRTTQPAGRLGCGDACSPFRVGEGPGLRPAAIPGPAPITHGNPG